MSDRGKIYAASFLRALANGLAGVVFGIYLAKLGHSVVTLGLVLSAGIAGATLATAIVTFRADRFGRRRTLVVLGLLSAIGGAITAMATDAALIAAAAFFGMLTGMGKDRGAMLALESATLPSSVDDAARTRAFAWHAVLQDAGQALGGLFAALPTLLRDSGVVDETASYRYTMLLYALLVAASLPLYARLSGASEPPAPALRRPISPRSRSILWKICALFSLDGIGGGFLGSALFSYFFFAWFGATEVQIATLFLGGKVMSAASHLAAAWLARRIGLVNTMVFTHIPSSLLLVAIPFAGSFWAAGLIYLLREGLAEMDVPTRTSYVMAVVEPEERTFASGATGIARLASWSVAPAIAGVTIQAASLATPLFIAAGLKIAYDVLLYVAFRQVRPPEER
ncbi:MAG TPA: MFS transporter [Burkholderiales bacterium]|nr:MFS transporter [Burkholderiales bacterium]